MLSRLALRLCAVYALKGRTFAGDEVRDSEIVPIDPEGNVGDTKPFIAAYTDDQGPDGLTLTLETGVSARMIQVDPETGAPVLDEATHQPRLAPGIPPTDAGIEAMLDMMERQINVAFADEANGWAQLLKTGCSMALMNSTRGAMKTQQGERFAGRQIVFVGKPLADPEFGRAIRGGSFWDLFLTKAEGEPSLGKFAMAMRALLTDGASVEAWRLVLRAMGLALAAGDALGIRPVTGDVAAPMADFDVEGGSA